MMHNLNNGAWHEKIENFVGHAWMALLLYDESVAEIQRQLALLVMPTVCGGGITNKCRAHRAMNLISFAVDSLNV